MAEGAFLPFVQSPASKALFDVYAEAALDLGFKVEGEFTGGSADSGLTANAGVPTLCATGGVGGKPHTTEEYLLLGSLSSAGEGAGTNHPAPQVLSTRGTGAVAN